jgi:hypothetical protein
VKTHQKQNIGGKAHAKEDDENIELFGCGWDFDEHGASGCGGRCIGSFK